MKSFRYYGAVAKRDRIVADRAPIAAETLTAVDGGLEKRAGRDYPKQQADHQPDRQSPSHSWARNAIAYARPLQAFDYELAGPCTANTAIPVRHIPHFYGLIDE